MKKILFIVALIVLVALPAGIMAEENTSETMTPMVKTTLWFLKFNYEIKAKEYKVKYDLSSSVAPETVFYNVYSLNRLGNLSDLKMEKQKKDLFSELLFREQIYLVDTNNDGKPDVRHRISFMPTKYIKDEFCREWNVQMGTTHGLLKLIALMFEKGFDPDTITFSQEPQIVVNVQIDLPPYDGIMDVVVSDVNHPAETIKDSYGGDGVPDNERILETLSDEKTLPPEETTPTAPVIPVSASIKI